MKRPFRIVLAIIAAVGALLTVIWWSREAAVVSQSPLAEPTRPGVDVYSPSPYAVDVTSGHAVTEAQAMWPSLPTAVISNCRFGYNVAHQPLSVFDPNELARLRASAFFRWAVSDSPETVNGMEPGQVVRIHQTKVSDEWNAEYVRPYTYTIRSPSASTLAESLDRLEVLAALNPGMLWLVGNEMERQDWPGGSQDEIVPGLYARAYHHIYHAIKAGDPTARVAIGGVIQATPLRLEYLDRAWNEYRRRYGQRMPVDVWNIHAFVLREKRDYGSCADCWGAGVPAGIDADAGILYDTADNKDFSIAREHIRAFRKWMRDKGERNKPLIISEYGVLMPPEWAGFSFEEVRDEFMYPSFDMFLNERDPELGYPADDNRLVQLLYWYSLEDDAKHAVSGDHQFNGWLFYSGLFGDAKGIAPLGHYWEDYVINPAKAPVEVDLLPALTWTDPPAGYSGGELVTMTLSAEIANSGSISAGERFTVEIRDQKDGSLIGATSVGHLEGCGGKVVVTATWRDLSTGVHNAVVHVDPTGAVTAEANTANNRKVITVLVATERVFLPAVIKLD